MELLTYMVEHEIVFGAPLVSLKCLIGRCEYRDMPVHQRAICDWVTFQQLVELQTEENKMSNDMKSLRMYCKSCMYPHRKLAIT